MSATALTSAVRTKHQIAFRYRNTDSPMGVTRTTTQRLAAYLGMDETQAIHAALASFAITHLPQYEQDEGELTDAQMAEIDRLAAPQLAAMRKVVPDKVRSVRSSLFGISA
jgi:hypothetical protein